MTFSNRKHGQNVIENAIQCLEIQLGHLMKEHSFSKSFCLDSLNIAAIVDMYPRYKQAGLLL